MIRARTQVGRSLVALVAVLLIALLVPGAVAAKQTADLADNRSAVPAGQHDNGKGKVVNVMTRNLYLGADLGPAIASKSLAELVTANGIILRQVIANEFPTRAEGLADEILATRPDLVGLQEVALWQTTPITPAGEALTIDYLQLLLDELNEGNGKDGNGKPQYRVVVVQDEFDLEAPADANGIAGDGPGGELANAEVMGQLTMRDVILARHGAGVHTWNEQGGNFKTLLQLPIAGQAVSVKRGWTATDARVRGSKPFRFVNTHLEAFHPLIREAQAKELVAPGGPATGPLPVVLVGDINSDDDTVAGPDRLAYQVLLAAGFVSRSTNDPLSCCLDSPLLAVGAGGDVSDFDHQVDHVMTNAPALIALQSSLVTGLQPVNGFWNSDHAGVFSSLRFGGR
ncbi:MAG TPA: endonuclease/exonuclease/phosphatase family protein [Solirubrobacterales bacterium]|nr:endonuclease/exonuclease/phosphatase family protein [Solirubrobacterales bacterium]